MGKIRNSLNMRIKGKVGAYSFYTATGGRQIVRPAQNDSNYGESASRTESQQERRARWGNLVNFYKANRSWIKKAFETKKSNQSDYNKLMSLNINVSPIYLTKDECAQGGCVPAEYKVSEGSLQPITSGFSGEYMDSTISIDVNPQATGLTVGTFAANLISHNSFLEYGDQISIIMMECIEDEIGIPRTTIKKIEVTLEQGSSVLLSSLDTEGLLENHSDILAATYGGNGSYAFWILSRKSSGVLKVSTETLKAFDDDLIEEYSSDEQREAAIESYGVSETSFLDPGSSEQETPVTPGTAVTITTASSPAGAGTVAGGGDAVVGQTKTITATANSGYEFKFWVVDGVQVSGNPLNLVVTGNMQVTAIFVVA